MDRPTDEDMTRDLGAYLEMAARFRQQSELNLAASRTHPSGTGYTEFLYESPLVAEAAARRATHAEAELARLRAFFEEFTDGVGPCACCGTLLGWVFAGDGTYDRELWTGQKHDCPVSAEDFRNGKFPQGTYRFQERRAIDAEAELARLREEAASQRRKGRIDACRVLNEAASRFPAASKILRECVRDIERMDR